MSKSSIASYVVQRSLGTVPSSLFPADVSSLYNVYDGIPYQKDILGHFGCVNAVELNKSESLIASGGDDRRVFVWHSSHIMTEQQPKPIAIMQEKHFSNIFALEFSNDNRMVMSGGNDGLLLTHDVETRQMIGRYNGNHESVYNICCNPLDDHTVATTRDNGTLTLYDIREDCRSSQAITLKISEPGGQFYSGQYNPCFSPLMAVASNTRRGVLLYDLRCIERGDLLDGQLKGLTPQGAIYARWNSTGTALGVLRARAGPLYIDLLNKRFVSCKDRRYENRHTIKSLDFIDDSAIVTGSDNFNLYVWKIPNLDYPQDNDSSLITLLKSKGTLTKKWSRRAALLREDQISRQKLNSSDAVLKGHRSIVNHVRYSPRNKMLVSCGVEKIIKCWSALEFPYSYDVPKLRALGSRASRRNRRQNDMFGLGGDDDDDDDSEESMDLDSDEEQRDAVEDDSTAENLAMLHYFDGLIQTTRRANRFTIMDRRNGNPDPAALRRGDIDRIEDLEEVQARRRREADSDSSSSSRSLSRFGIIRFNRGESVSLPEDDILGGPSGSDSLSPSSRPIAADPEQPRSGSLIALVRRLRADPSRSLTSPPLPESEASPDDEMDGDASAAASNSSQIPNPQSDSGSSSGSQASTSTNDEAQPISTWPPPSPTP